VLTRRHIVYHSYDKDLGNDARNCRVIRTESLDPARILYRLGMRQYNVSRWHIPIKRTINFPDNKMPWAPFAYDAGTAIDFDCIFVTAPPFSSFITGYYLTKRTGKALIADFRDAWLEFPFLPYKGRIQRDFVRYWEEKIVGRANVIVVVDDNIKRALVERYPYAARKIHIIPNGYDPDDFVPIRHPEVFTISYLGTIRGERDPQNLLDATESFMDKNCIRAEECRLKFIGHVEPKFLKRISKYRFAVTTGHLPYQKAIAEFCASHVAVLITTGSKYFFPSRQNEYLASGLPIIVCGKSKGIHLLQDAFKKGYPGWIFDYKDVEGMRRRLSEIYRKYRKGITIKGKMPYVEYTREKLTGKLAEIIKRV